MTFEDEIYLTQAEYYMNECFELAKNAFGKTSPNPIVGAIVLDNNGMPVGKGFHAKAGTEHAEILALKEAGKQAKDGTLIVNLEPCCHYGKTPPCTDLIIESKIKEVVFSNYDPNPLVNKKGSKILQENNIKVIPEVLEKEGYELNKFFFKWVNKKIPWITLKQAQTLDGKIGLKNKAKVQITGEAAKKEVHNLRNIYDAILIGNNTVKIDNPELTVREISNGRNPVRVILDKDLSIDKDSNIFKNNASVILVTKSGHKTSLINNFLKTNKHIELLEIPCLETGELDLGKLFFELGKREILSVLIESGPTLASELIQKKLIDEYILFIAPVILGEEGTVSSLNIKIPETTNSSYNFALSDYKLIGNDFMFSLRPTS